MAPLELHITQHWEVLEQSYLLRFRSFPVKNIVWLSVEQAKELLLVTMEGVPVALLLCTAEQVEVPQILENLRILYKIAY